MKMVLASASPRRRDLLEQAGFELTIRPAHVDESPYPEERPVDHVCRLAAAKAEAVAESVADCVVLGADTVVVAPNDGILGKPADALEARRMLASLSGRWHDVVTGVCLTHRRRGIRDVWWCNTRVCFRELSRDDIDAYLERVDPLDKAGGYAIQEHGEMIVSEIDGRRSNVIGLPVEEVVERCRLVTAGGGVK